MVRDETHRVDGLDGGSRRNEEAPSREALLCGGEQPGDRLDDVGGLGQTPLALKSARQFAGLGLDYPYAAAAQRRKVGLRGRMGEHVESMAGATTTGQRAER